MPGLLPVTTEGSRLGVMLSGLDLIHFGFSAGIKSRSATSSVQPQSVADSFSKIENPSKSRLNGSYGSAPGTGRAVSGIVQLSAEWSSA